MGSAGGWGGVYIFNVGVTLQENVAKFDVLDYRQIEYYFLGDREKYKGTRREIKGMFHKKERKKERKKEIKEGRKEERKKERKKERKLKY